MSAAADTRGGAVDGDAGGVRRRQLLLFTDIGRAGLGAGASSAGQKVADYLIRRSSAISWTRCDPTPCRPQPPSAW